jgi:hypothetical protein
LKDTFRAITRFTGPSLYGANGAATVDFNQQVSGFSGMNPLLCLNNALICLFLLFIFVIHPVIIYIYKIINIEVWIICLYFNLLALSRSYIINRFRSFLIPALN